MADEHMDDAQREPEEQINELDETELDEVSGGRRVGAGCKVCRDCGAKYLKSSGKCPLCGSRAATIVSFR